MKGPSLGDMTHSWDPKIGWFATNDKGRDLRYDNFSGAKWWVSSDFAPFYWNSQCSMLQSPCLLGTPSILATKTFSFSAVFAGDISILLLNHVKLSNSHFSRANFNFWMIFGCRDPHDPPCPTGTARRDPSLGLCWSWSIDGATLRGYGGFAAFTNRIMGIDDEWLVSPLENCWFTNLIIVISKLISE